MILQALTEYYQVLSRQGKIAAPGWSPVKVSFALCIGEDGDAGTGHLHPDRAAAGEKNCVGTASPLPPRAGEAVQRRGRQLSL